MLSFRAYLKGNKDRGTITKLKQFQKSYPDYDYGPQNGPTPNSDVDNFSASLGLGMGGENEESPKKLEKGSMLTVDQLLAAAKRYKGRKGVNRWFPKPEEQEMNLDNVVPGDSNPRDPSYEEPQSSSAASNNHGEEPQDPDRADDDVELPATDGEQPVEDETQDPNRQGTIRHVPNAHLVFKRETEDGTYEELWLYNIGKNFKSDTQIRERILAGTDIPIEKMQSKDGTQYYDIWSIGNVQMLNIKGLPN